MSDLNILSRKDQENNRAYAYRLLRYNIMTLKLVPDTALNENEIAEQLGISRTPVHEALTLLKNDYLVDILPQNGSFISKISMRQVREGLFMRNTLEPAIYRQLSGNISEAYLQQMAQSIEASKAMTLSGSDDSLDRYIKLDDEFHKLAYLAAGKPTLWTSMKTVCSHFQRIRYQEFLVMQINMNHICEEHRHLYEYLLYGGSSYFDLDAFYDRHLSYFKTYLPELMRANPEYYVFD